MSKQILIESRFTLNDIVALRINPDKIMCIAEVRVLGVDENGVANIWHYTCFDEEGRTFEFNDKDLILDEEFKDNG